MSTQHSPEAVLQALQALYHDPSPEAKRKANEWLQEFQHSMEAWQTCHVLLTSDTSPLEGRLFAAQTLRTKILYDRDDLSLDQLSSLRDSLIDSLSSFHSSSAPVGSKAIIVQLHLALSDLALQLPTWSNPCGFMIQKYGQDPSTVGLLLGFLKAIVEEALDPRIPISTTPDQGIVGAAQQVCDVLSMYIQAPGITENIQAAVFETLRSWVSAGEILASQVLQTPLFNAAFEALPSDPLFDSAVDVLCDLIHDTQEVEDNISAIQQVIPRLVALRPQLETHQDDPDRIRGYCRILCEAGETYSQLIARHPQEFLPLVQAIAECAAYPDLDIVPITFNFWYELATALGRQPTDPSLQPLLDIYSNLQTVITKHLHFPSDDEEQTAQERDDFRMFRHRMGDTLKDCCHVLGAATCLRKSYQLVVDAMAKPTPSWQEIEAPLFSMRSMGAEVDPDDDEVLPHIMDMLPKLPDHSRIRYAAILVISRYTQWIDRHPDNLSFQLQYISAGFDMADEEVSAAAAQAMKFMCQDCNQHLVPFLPQLHAFISTVGSKLDQADMVEVCEAIGYVISSMPPSEGAPALQQFCQPLIQRVQVVATAQAEASKDDLQKVADALEQLDAYLSVVKTFEPVPETCFSTAVDMYTILDSLIARYASKYYISERIATVLRRGIAFYPTRALEPLLEPVMSRMSSSFAATHYASYLWIIGKLAAKFGDVTSAPGSDGVTRLICGAFEAVTGEMEVLLSQKQPVAVPDVMDDYVHCLSAYLTSLPTATIASPALSPAVHHVLSALACPAPETTLVCLDTLFLLAQRLSHAQFQPSLQPIFAQWGKHLLVLLLSGVTQQFPEDGLDQVREIVIATVSCSPPEQVEQWAVEGMEKIPGHVVPQAEKAKFVAELHEYLLAPGTDRLGNALNALVRAARKAKDRSRQTRKSLGGM